MWFVASSSESLRFFLSVFRTGRQEKCRPKADEADDPNSDEGVAEGVVARLTVDPRYLVHHVGRLPGERLLHLLVAHGAHAALHRGRELLLLRGIEDGAIGGARGDAGDDRGDEDRPGDRRPKRG